MVFQFFLNHWRNQASTSMFASRHNLICQLTSCDDVLGNALSQRLVFNEVIDGVISLDLHVQSHKTPSPISSKFVAWRADKFSQIEHRMRLFQCY